MLQDKQFQSCDVFEIIFIDTDLSCVFVNVDIFVDIQQNGMRC